MADRIVVMNDGIAQQVGPPQELYDDPANLFVAGFIGAPAMNLLEATLREDSGAPGDVTVMIGSEALAAVQRPSSMPVTGRVIAGIRPERMSFGADANGIPAEVDLVEATGIGMIMHIKAGGQLLKIYTTDRIKFRSGDRLAMHIDPLDLLLFDVDSGKRLRPLSQGAAHP